MAEARGHNMKYLIFLLITPAFALADCPQYGLYAFALVGCPEYEFGVNTTIPLCKQEPWKHLSYYDYRCYEALPIDYSRTDWSAPTPYEQLWREPISGKTRTFPGTYEAADWNYRACRQTLGDLNNKKRRR